MPILSTSAKLVGLSIIGALLTLALTGCSGKDSPEPEEEAPQELTSGSKAAVETPEAELLREGKRYFDAGVFSVARDVFERLRDGYPLGAYAEFADIKIGDCEFESSNFTAAAAHYEEFLKSRPGSPSTPYILLRAARSHQLSNKGVGRDDANLRRARELYKDLLQRFPNSPYHAGAREYLAQTEKLLAANEQLVIDFYRKKGKEPAIEARLAHYQERFGALPPDEEPELDFQPPQEPVAEAPIGSQPMVERVLADSSVQPPERGASKDSPSNRISAAEARASRRAAARIPVVRLVECDRSEGLMFLHISTPLPNPGAIERLSPVLRRGTLFSLVLNGVTTPGGGTLVRDCFGKEDVTVDSSGVVEIQADKLSWQTAQILELDNPTRVLLTFQ